MMGIRRNYKGAGAWLLLMSMAACHAELRGETVVVEERVSVFDPCSFDSHCPVPSNCESVTVRYPDYDVTDQFCTLDCVHDFDCLAGSVCRDTFSSALCFEECAFDGDCPRGFGCELADFGAVGQRHVVSQ
jgi:hypothetical protein